MIFVFSVKNEYQINNVHVNIYTVVKYKHGLCFYLNNIQKGGQFT